MNKSLNKVSEPEDCPRCGTKLPPQFSTGRVVCGKCGWTNQPKNVAAPSVDQNLEEAVLPLIYESKSTSRKYFFDTGSLGVRIFGWLLFALGVCFLGIGLAYDSTIESGEFGNRTHNIGKISNKNTYTNTGGFIAVCGAIFATYGSLQKKENQENDTSN